MFSTSRGPGMAGIQSRRIRPFASADCLWEEDVDDKLGGEQAPQHLRCDGRQSHAIRRCPPSQRKQALFLQDHDHGAMCTAIRPSSILAATHRVGVDLLTNVLVCMYRRAITCTLMAREVATTLQSRRRRRLAGTTFGTSKEVGRTPEVKCITLPLATRFTMHTICPTYLSCRF